MRSALCFSQSRRAWKIACASVASCCAFIPGSYSSSDTRALETDSLPIDASQAIQAVVCACTAVIVIASHYRYAKQIAWLSFCGLRFRVVKRRCPSNKALIHSNTITMTDGQKKAERAGEPRNKAKMDASVSAVSPSLTFRPPLTYPDWQVADAGTQPLRLDTLAPEIISMIFEEAREESASYERLRYSLICKSLQPFGEEILYREVDFLDIEHGEKLCSSAQPGWYTAINERYESARRSIDLVDSLLPRLQTPQIAHFRHLSLDLASPAVPQSWLQTALDQLFFLFRTSDSELDLLLAFRSLNTALIRLLTETGKTAFRLVTVEFLDFRDQKGPAEMALPTLADVVLVEPNKDEHGFLACSAWTQKQTSNWLLWALEDEKARQIYFISAHGKGLYRSVTAAALVTTVEMVPMSASTSAFRLLEASLEAFQQVRVVKLDLREIVGHPDLEVTWKVKLPASTTTLVVEFDEVRPSYMQLLALYDDRKWAADIKVFRWKFWPDKAGPARPATDDELALVKNGHSWHSAFAAIFADRKARLEIWVGENDWRVVVGNAEGGPPSTTGAVAAQTAAV